MARADELTDAEIHALIALPKVVTQKERRKMKWRLDGANFKLKIHLKADYAAFFYLWGRRLEDDQMDFSIGLRVEFRDGSGLNLMRCNGLHGQHFNHIEKTKFTLQRHVHLATERYIQNKFQAEEYAEPTNEYVSYDAALEYLVERCNITYEDVDFVR